nr:PREDICTED: uncharacterized protein LOC102357794 [Latimeria chalumnae]|eukprot:XP_005999239.2 PREDICTED: uncharacterized protein LOC102357794 [Latimeria chalumnae]
MPHCFSDTGIFQFLKEYQIGNAESAHGFLDTVASERATPVAPKDAPDKRPKSTKPKKTVRELIKERRTKMGREAQHNPAADDVNDDFAMVCDIIGRELNLNDLPQPSWAQPEPPCPPGCWAAGAPGTCIASCLLAQESGDAPSNLQGVQPGFPAPELLAETAGLSGAQAGSKVQQSGLYAKTSMLHGTIVVTSYPLEDPAEQNVLDRFPNDPDLSEQQAMLRAQSPPLQVKECPFLQEVEEIMYKLDQIPYEEFVSTDSNGRNILHRVVTLGSRTLAYVTAEKMAGLGKLDDTDNCGKVSGGVYF